MSMLLLNFNIRTFLVSSLPNCTNFLDYTLHVPELNDKIQDQKFELFYKRASNVC